jgi:sugar phosphate isomerase/epimerase
MKIQFYRTLWGYTKPLETYLGSLKQRGYIGVETGLLFLTASEKEELPRWLQQYRLDLILTVITLGNEEGATSVDKHLKSYQRQVEEALQYPVRPQKINIHGGVDAWTRDERQEFYTKIFAWEEAHLRVKYQALPPIVHETHRSRCFYTPWTTAETLRAFPQLRLNCDLSHWVLVCERFLDGEEFQKDMELVMER